MDFGGAFPRGGNWTMCKGGLPISRKEMDQLELDIYGRYIVEDLIHAINSSLYIYISIYIYYDDWMLVLSWDIYMLFDDWMGPMACWVTPIVPEPGCDPSQVMAWEALSLIARGWQCCGSSMRVVMGVEPPGDGRNLQLVGGLAHFLFSHILGFSSSQLTFIFFRGVQTTNQTNFARITSNHQYITGMIICKLEI